ncbi:MAG: hypothetical protein V3V19_04315 [Cocleimonas sp.]
MKKIVFHILIATILLAGCKQEITSTLYVRDITEVISNKKPLKSSATIKLEMLTDQSCRKKEESITKIISAFFMKLEKTQCIKEGSDTYYYAVFDLPVLLISGSKVNDNYKGGVSVQLSKKEDNRTEIFLTMNLELLSTLDNSLRSEFMGSGGISPSGMQIKIKINNDDRETYRLYTEGSFLDGEAIISRFGKEVELQKRDESIIMLSDVSVSALLGRGTTSFTYVGSVMPIESEKTQPKKK